MEYLKDLINEMDKMRMRFAKEPQPLSTQNSLAYRSAIVGMLICSWRYAVRNGLGYRFRGMLNKEQLALTESYMPHFTHPMYMMPHLERKS